MNTDNEGWEKLAIEWAFAMIIMLKETANEAGYYLTFSGILLCIYEIIGSKLVSLFL